MKREKRKVLLLIDNFSTYELTIKQIRGKDTLSNVEIEWLPPNTTSHWQRLDQGIIASFKLQYRKMWIAFMIKEYDRNKNPLKTMNLLFTIRWYVQSWRHYVRQLTIECY